MSSPLETLFLPFVRGDFAIPPLQKVLFLNAQYYPFCAQIPQLKMQQFFKPYAQTLVNHGCAVVQDLPLDEQKYDYVIVAFPKNLVEGKGLIAQGLMQLKQGGTLVCAADNKAGGTRLRKIYEEFGLENIFDESKNKARVVWAKSQLLDQNTIQAALKEAAEQKICDGQFSSIPGIFGWDKIDKGSEILVSVLPDQISGKGADFGCGYGYLSEYLLHNNLKIKHITCIDADFRAVQMCRQNLNPYEGRTDFLWADLTHPVKTLRNLDFIIMNPPFHEGKTADCSIGKAFIQNAALALRAGGKLYMVANRHLPYEKMVQKQFSSLKKLKETNGFKIFSAQK